MIHFIDRLLFFIFLHYDYISGMGLFFVSFNGIRLVFLALTQLLLSALLIKPITFKTAVITKVLKIR